MQNKDEIDEKQSKERWGVYPHLLPIILPTKEPIPLCPSAVAVVAGS